MNTFDRPWNPPAAFARALLIILAAACGRSTDEGVADGGLGAGGSMVPDAPGLNDGASGLGPDGQSDAPIRNDVGQPPPFDAGAAGAGNGGAAGADADSGAGGQGGAAGSGGAGASSGLDGGGGQSDEGGSAHDAGALDVEAPDGVDGSSNTCLLHMSMTTVSNNGTFSPRNVGAIWIATESDHFVKTLEHWAGPRGSMLTLWNSTIMASPLPAISVDTITSATRSTYGQHARTWNCTDSATQIVPDGAYRLYFEMTDQGPNGPFAFVPFTKGPTPFQQSPPDSAPFTSISLSYTP